LQPPEFQRRAARDAFCPAGHRYASPFPAYAAGFLSKVCKPGADEASLAQDKVIEDQEGEDEEVEVEESKTDDFTHLATTECADSYSRCPEYSRKGYCKEPWQGPWSFNWKWIQANCPLSCGVCKPGADEASLAQDEVIEDHEGDDEQVEVEESKTGDFTHMATTECANSYSRCPEYSRKGYCEEPWQGPWSFNWKWMQANCPLSCGMCQHVTEEASLAQEEVIKEREGENEEVDVEESETDDFTHLATTECADSYSRCPEYSRKGYCEEPWQGPWNFDWKWMQANCQLSCELCQQDTKEASLAQEEVIEDEKEDEEVESEESETEHFTHMTMGCADSHSRCPEWSRAGYCEEPWQSPWKNGNWKWMQVNCQLSCGTCQLGTMRTKKADLRRRS